MVQYPSQTLPMDSEHKYLVERLDSGSLSVDRNTTVSAADGISAPTSHTIKSRLWNPTPCPTDSIAPAELSPTTLPYLCELPPLAVAACRSRAVPSPDSHSAPALGVSGRKEPTNTAFINIASPPHSRSTTISPPQPSPSSPLSPLPTAVPTISIVSAPPFASSSASSRSVRCSGLRKSRSRPGQCARMVRRLPHTEQDVPHYCHDHQDQGIGRTQSSSPPLKPSSSPAGSVRCSGMCKSRSGQCAKMVRRQPHTKQGVPHYCHYHKDQGIAHTQSSPSPPKPSSSPAGSVRCSGMCKSRHGQCARKIDIRRLPHTEQGVPYYCHDHRDQGIVRTQSLPSKSFSSPAGSVRCSGTHESRPGQCAGRVQRLPLTEENVPHHCRDHREQGMVCTQFPPQKSFEAPVKFTRN